MQENLGLKTSTNTTTITLDGISRAKPLILSVILASASLLEAGNRFPSVKLSIRKNPFFTLQNLPVNGNNLIMSDYLEKRKKGVRHHGVDIVTEDPRARIVAVADGEVVYSGIINGYGNCVVVAHHSNLPGNIHTLYGHLKTISVKVGDWVRPGSSLGIIGMTGEATGIHCHFEVLQKVPKENIQEYILNGAHYLDPAIVFEYGHKLNTTNSPSATPPAKNKKGKGKQSPE